jgi:hypothetical protein
LNSKSTGFLSTKSISSRRIIVAEEEQPRD